MHTTIIAEGTDKQRLLRRLDKAWAALKESYAGLSDRQLTEPGVTGDWSVKDTLAHVATWIWRHRRLQRQDDRAEAGPLAPSRAEAIRGHSRPPHRFRPADTRSAIHARHALPSPPTARHIQSRPAARPRDTRLATAATRRMTAGAPGCSRRSVPLHELAQRRAQVLSRAAEVRMHDQRQPKEVGRFAELAERQVAEALTRKRPEMARVARERLAAVGDRA